MHMSNIISIFIIIHIIHLQSLAQGEYNMLFRYTFNLTPENKKTLSIAEAVILPPYRYTLPNTVNSQVTKLLEFLNSSL